MGRSGRADRDHRAGADVDDALAMRVAIGRVVRAHDAVAAAQQRHAGRDAEAESLQRRELRFRMPEIRCRTDGVGLLAGLVPEVRPAAAHGLDQAVPGMGVAVDRPGSTAMCLASMTRRGMPRQDVRGRADIDDPVLFDGDRAVRDDAVLRIDGDHGRRS